MKTNIVFKKATILALAIAVLPSMVSAALYRQLEFGSRGADVSELQTFLASDPSVYPQGIVSGYFGPLTQAAVRQFQAKNGISQVGRVGPITMAAINAQMAGGGGTVSAGQAPSFLAWPTTSLNGRIGTVNVTTNVPTRATLYYSTSPLNVTEVITTNPATVAVIGASTSVSGNLQQTHTFTTAELSPSSVYYYMVAVADANGNVSVTYPRATFQTGSF